MVLASTDFRLPAAGIGAVRHQLNPVARILRFGADAWRPARPPATGPWCARELHLPADTSAAPGPFDLTNRPYWREPLELIDDPEVRTISIMGAAQDLGKTVLLQAMAISRSVVDPAPSMLAGPDQDAMRELRDKFYGMAEASPAVAGRIPPERLRNDRWIDLGTMYIYLAYSGSKQRLRARACKYVFCTEVDVWQDDPRVGQSARIIQARTKAFIECKIVYESTPTDEASTIDAFYQRSDRRKFILRCPRCNHPQELRFFPHKSGKFAGRGGVAGMQDKHGAWLTSEQARGEAYYIGECGCRITSDQKPDMILGGRWVPRGQSLKGDKLVGQPARGPRNVGYQISSLYAQNQTFGDLAEAYLDHREAGQLRAFYNNWLGLPDRAASKVPNWKTLGQRLAWQHLRGTVPADAFFLTSVADVQSDRTRAGVRAWGDKRSSWLVDWYEFPKEKGENEGDATRPGAPIASDLARLENEILAPTFPLVSKNAFGQAELSVRVLGVDTNYRMFELHNFTRAARGRFGDRVRNVRGDHKVDPTQLYRMTVVEHNARSGERYEGGLELWGVYVNAFREQLLALFGCEVNLPGAWLLTADILAQPGGQDYLRQLTNQGPVTEINNAGKEIRRWVTRDRALGEHFWDIEVNQLAMAEMVTGGNWDASTWRRPATPVKREDQPPLTTVPRDVGDGSYSAR